MVSKISFSKKFFFLFILISWAMVFSRGAFAQVRPNQQNIKFPLWVLVDGVPSLEEKTDESVNGPWALAAEKLRAVAPFVLTGMVYGWDFVYTPSDAKRKVDEFFSFEPVKEIFIGDPLISFSEPTVDEHGAKLNVWVEYARTDLQYELRKHWDTVSFEKIQGEGSAYVWFGTDGLKDAYKEAVKNGVRAYAQKIEKNKPKEISGRVLLADKPLVGVQSGRYVVKVKLILNLQEVIHYTSF